MHDTAPPPAAPAWRQETWQTFRLAGPLALANLLQMAAYTVDTIFIARLGEEEFAASQLVMGIFGVVVWALNSLTAAVAPVISAELGANPRAVRAVRRAMRMALWLAVASGTLGIALAFLTIPAMQATGQEAHLIALAFPYLVMLVISLIPMVVANVLRTYVSALGRPIFATTIVLVGVFINAAGNYALIFGNWGAPRLELVGAGIATIITTTSIMCAYMLVIRLDPRLHRPRVFARLWAPDWSRLWQIVRIGSPIALTVIAEAGIFSAAVFMMGKFGTAQVAGHAIALQIAALAFQIPFGVGQAVTIRVGYHYGARDTEAIGRAARVAIAMGLAFTCVSALAMFQLPLLLMWPWVDPQLPSNAAVVGFALTYLVWAAVFQLADGLQAVALGALRGLQDTSVPMVIAIFSYWVPGLGVALTLGFLTPLAGVGVWIGLATGLFFAAALLSWRWRARTRLGLTLRPLKTTRPT